MSCALSAQVVVVATAVAISGTAIFLAISMQKSVVSTTSFFQLVSSSSSSSSNPTKQFPSRSCLSNPDGKRKKKKKKKVRFAENVKDTVGNSEEYRRANHKRLLEAQTDRDNCRAQSSDGTRAAVPENHVAVDPRLCN